jgi:hypothetical protein
MVYNTRNYCGFKTMSAVWCYEILENTTFRKLDMFLSSGEWGDI